MLKPCEEVLRPVLLNQICATRTVCDFFFSFFISCAEPPLRPLLQPQRRLGRHLQGQQSLLWTADAQFYLPLPQRWQVKYAQYSNVAVNILCLILSLLALSCSLCLSLARHLGRTDTQNDTLQLADLFLKKSF